MLTEGMAGSPRAAPREYPARIHCELSLNCRWVSGHGAAEGTVRPRCDAVLAGASLTRDQSGRGCSRLFCGLAPQSGTRGGLDSVLAVNGSTFRDPVGAGN